MYVKVNGSITQKNIDDLDGLCSIVGNLNKAWKFDTYMYPASRERSVDFDVQSRLSPEKGCGGKSEADARKEQDQFIIKCQDKMYKKYGIRMYN